ncbi:MAG TPA: hypothetical protein VE268_00925 [Herpetosiphonaceae bacterium]|nr:hypothetical protein [Herpetosiphonaceae bacterium]
MKTAYVVKGHVSDEGTIILDEPAALVPGPVLVTIMPVEEPEPAMSAYTDEEHAELLRRIAAIAALPEASAPDDGFSAKDYKAILYGPENGPNDVL